MTTEITAKTGNSQPIKKKGRQNYEHIMQERKESLPLPKYPKERMSNLT